MNTNTLLSRKANFIAHSLLDWYAKHARDLPWRNTKNPYRIWLSEIILQQTRVAQGLPYWQRFVETYPDVEALANAPEEEVMRLWQGLGYYSRARNLHACAKQVVAVYNGRFPATYEELLKLPGIGKYTAAAIASFAFLQPVPVVDGNVYRLLARLFGVTTDIQSGRAQQEFFAIAEQLIDPVQPDLFNQAIMEFGAVQCTPKKPLCLYCPLQEVCYAFKNQAQTNFPVKEKKVKVRKRFIHYLAIRTTDGRLLMRRRSKGDIWQGLFDFHWLEANEAKDFSELADPLLDLLSAEEARLEKSTSTLTHLLSHQRLLVQFHSFSCSAKPLNTWLKQHPEYGLYSAAEIEALPKPILIENYLKAD